MSCRRRVVDAKPKVKQAKNECVAGVWVTLLYVQRKIV